MKLPNYLYALGFLSLASPFFGAESNTPSIADLEKRLEELTIQTVWGTEGVRLAPGVPNPKGFGLLLSGEYLYWKSYENGLFQPIICDTHHSQDVGNLTFYSSEERVIEIAPVKFDFDSGYRIGIGYLAYWYDNWEAWGEYTQFQNNASYCASFPCATAPFCIPSELSEIDDVFVRVTDSSPVSLNSDWRIDFYNLDLFLGQSLFLSPHILIRPYFGGKASWIEQHGTLFAQAFTKDNFFISHSDGTSTPVESIDRDFSFCLETGTNKFWGVGPFFGINTKWFLGKYVNLAAQASAALLFGHFNVSQTVRQTEQDQEEYSEYFVPNPFSAICATTCFSYDPFAIVPTARIAVDIGFDCPMKEKLSISARIGYEANYYWRQNYLETGSLFLNSSFSVLSNSPADLALHGLVVSLGMCF